MSAAGEQAGAARHVVVIGGGPAGLMAAETARDAGTQQSIYEPDALGLPLEFLIAQRAG